jgi:hypothetical protein
MNRLILLSVAFGMLWTGQAIAQPADGLAAEGIDVVTETDEVEPPLIPIQKDPLTWLEEISAAFHEKNWSFVVGAILMLLIWGVRRAWSAITKKATTDAAKKALPWIALGLGVLLDISTGLINGISWWKAILSGLVSGGSAIALWESVFKHLFPNKKE